MTQAAGDPAHRPSPRRLAGIVAVFALLGPPVGALVFMLLLLGVSLASAVQGETGTGRMMAGTMLLGIVFALPLSYLVGGLSALVMGIFAAVWDAGNRRISLRLCLGVGLVLGALAASRPGGLYGATEGERFAQIALLLAHLVAAGVCGAVVRALFGPAKPHTPGSGGNP
jgi:hypothetical protein